ncbi:AMP-binding protein, partial [Streptococcus agalactiae]|nr:AMP-binding protein [Streptococcus agalactiae]
QAVCEQPQQALGDIQLMQQDEQQTWCQAPCAPAQQWLPELLNQHTSDNTALVWQDGSLTFAQLHTQANRLAHYLRDTGVGPDVCVAI